MTHAVKKAIVRFISTGHTTYAEIRESLPNVTDSQLEYLISPAVQDENLLYTDALRDQETGYTFRGSDRFFLTENGQDYLCSALHAKWCDETTQASLDAARESVSIAKESLGVSRESKTYAKKSFYVSVFAIGLSIISIIISIASFLKS